MVELEGVTPLARDQFGRCVQRFAEDLARETARLEEGDREQAAQAPEVTASNVIRANEWVRNPTSDSVDSRPRSNFDIAVQIIAPVSAAATGVMGSYLESLWQAGLFTGLAVIALISTIYVVWRRL